MRKKIVTTLFVCIVSVILAACFAACGGTSDVAGKTYVFDDMVVSYDDTVAEEVKTQMTAEIENVKAAAKDSTVTFGTDGTFKIKAGNTETEGTYTQNGNEVECTAGQTTQTFTVDGDKISVSHEDGGVTMTMVYKAR